ncbi:hypothetical protein GQ43DRAFT_436871 [Delitschia confertaspora ATCC 74209]|uniref:Uncharacterized protein n=1 Tax=Delitschia confertaspora ATCC 74209 TaxID=1513339 RepID=A0A9P4JWH7_9PLEO|nr:hypothetical protein GQ43DRAFT_436871 [Delitschia confertaspora ATCC 74209]
MDSKDVEQSKALLEDQYNNFEITPHVKARKDLCFNLRSSGVILSLVLYSFAVSSLAGYMFFQGRKHTAPYTPAQTVVEYKMMPAREYAHSIYSANPSPEVDKAWNDLVSPIHFNATKEELRLANDDPDNTVRFFEGGYLGGIGVYHQLHCLRRLYWNLNEEYYFPNRTSAKRTREIGHAVHCLEVILQNLMCTPNTALYSFAYNPETDTIPVLKSKSQRQCVKWEPFHAWATSRSVPYNVTLLASKNLLEKLDMSKLEGER